MIKKQVIIYCFNNYKDFLNKYIFSTVDTLSDMKITSMQYAQQKYERVIYGLYAGIRELLKLNLDDINFNDILQVNKIYKRIKHKSTLIRQGVYELIKEIILVDKIIISDKLQYLAPLCISAVNEKTSSVIIYMWSMLLHFCKAFPEAWKYVNFTEFFIPKLMELLLTAGYKNPKPLNYFLYEFVKLIPKDIINEANNFYRLCIINIWKSIPISPTKPGKENDSLNLLFSFFNNILVIVI